MSPAVREQLLYSARQAADALALDVATVYKLAAAGELDKVYIGKGTRMFRIPAQSLKSYAESLPTEPLT